MKATKLRELYYAEPFRPFALTLSDGRRITVPEPELLSLSPNGRFGHVFGPDGTSQYFQLDEIARVEFKNGGTRRRKAG